jgi:hypothetical protein
LTGILDFGLPILDGSDAVGNFQVGAGQRIYFKQDQSKIQNPKSKIQNPKSKISTSTEGR